MESDISVLEQRLGDRCEAAKLALEDAHEWVQRFTTLVFILAAGTTIVLLVALGYLLAGRTAGAIAGGAGTVVTGTAAGFVLNQKNEAQKREDTLRRVMHKVCT